LWVQLSEGFQVLPGSMPLSRELHSRIAIPGGFVLECDQSHNRATG
jgi:hypothetical protein